MSRSRFQVTKDARSVQLTDLGGGNFLALSSDGVTRYNVSSTSCDCPAGRNGRVCKHRTSVIDRVGINCPDCNRPRCPRFDMVMGVEYCGGKGRFGCATASMRPNHNVSSDDDIFEPPVPDPGVLSECTHCGHQAMVYKGGFSRCMRCTVAGFMRPVKGVA